MIVIIVTFLHLLHLNKIIALLLLYIIQYYLKK